MLGLTEYTDPTTRGSYRKHPIPVTNANTYADSPLLPVKHEIKGTDSNSVILFKDVKVLDSTGREPFPGDVLIRGERIVKVSAKINEDKVKETDPQVHIIEGKGRTLMSGLCDAHTHLSWNNSPDLEGLGHLPPEEHTIFAIRAARTYLDYGYTMCFGAASAKARLDCVIRDAINAGEIAGPRYLANAQEIARRHGALIDSISAFADGPEDITIAVLKNVALGADQVKLSMSGESITEKVMADENFFTDEETKAACDAAHKQGKRVCSHARSVDSVKMSARWGVDVIYHASFTDEETLDLLESKKDRIWVAPAINWITETLTSASEWGCTPEHAIEIGYKDELEEAIKSMKAMKARGIKLLPGGDYGFAWTPHGTYARDLEHFVNLFGYTPMEAIIAATAVLFMRPHELGKVLPGYYADLILVDGNPLDDIRILQDKDKLHYILIDGRVHKCMS
ncbi:amidohydrolase [Dacryopinax primogenitus]|uniref:Amidohydrolase n=1 Tax=Dacryopinax primogenitus (strain DJM 731) TaxID=1858805 RepID=M5G163_DACPD|nr:amidohydrolase [Dacryopinax primogenitus]EJU01915.1 amidohydrolase [Dacryopinax primogenitus]